MGVAVNVAIHQRGRHLLSDRKFLKKKEEETE